MHIEQLWIKSLPPLQDFTIKFSRPMTVIRGSNGLGKTLILEAMSLLGHVPVLNFREWTGPHVPQVRLRVSLRGADLRFIDALWDEKAPSGLSAFGKQCQVHNLAIPQYAKFWSTESLQSATQAAHRYRSKDSGAAEKARKDTFLELGFHLDNNPEYTDPRRESYGFLKECLSNELGDSELADVRRSSIQRNWMVLCSTHDDYLMLGLLQSFNRPALVAPTAESNWYPTSRTVLLDAEAVGAQACPKPGIVSYVNTDMYEWGTGLDLRESPKHLREDLTRVLLRRLQLMRLGKNIHGASEYQLRFAAELIERWRELFSGQGTPDLTAVTHDPQNPSDPWRVSIGNQASDFASSGENQIFFLLALTVGLKPVGSCLLLDEPELHLSFSASGNLFKFLLQLSAEMDCQIVAVTHTLFHLAQSGPDIGLVYLDRDASGAAPRTRPFYDGQAMEKFARVTHLDIKNALKPMMLPRRDVRLSWTRLGDLLLPPSASSYFMRHAASVWRRIFGAARGPK